MRIKIWMALAIFIIAGCSTKTGAEKKIVGTWKPTLAILNGKEIRDFEGEHRIYFEKDGGYRSLKGGQVTEKGEWKIEKNTLLTKTVKIGDGDKKQNISQLTIKTLTGTKLVLFHGSGKFELVAHFEKVKK